jgi:hypothetical protein
MEKLKRLIELKRRLRLANGRAMRATKAQHKILNERNKLLATFTEDEKRLYKEQIQKACTL